MSVSGKGLSTAHLSMLTCCFSWQEQLTTLRYRSGPVSNSTLLYFFVPLQYSFTLNVYRRHSHISRLYFPAVLALACSLDENDLFIAPRRCVLFSVTLSWTRLDFPLHLRATVSASLLSQPGEYKAV